MKGLLKDPASASLAELDIISVTLQLLIGFSNPSNVSICKQIAYEVHSIQGSII